MTVATARCSATLQAAAFGQPAVPCTQTVGLTRVGTAYAWRGPFA